MEKLAVFVLEDVNNDNVGDVPLWGITMTIDGLLPQFPISISTDQTGYYEFWDIPAGDYILSVQDLSELDPDMVLVEGIDNSPDDAVDLDDQATGVTFDTQIPVRVAAGEHDQDNNFMGEQHGTVQGRVRVDIDGDGYGEEFGDGITIELDSDFGVISTTITDIGGFYKFSDLATGSYFVRIKLENGEQVIYDGDSTPEDSNDAVDSLKDGLIPVFLEPGEDDRNNDFLIEE